MARIIVPTPLTLISSNVVASTYVPWSSTITYAEGARRTYTVGGIVHEYESLVDNNYGNQPDQSPAQWLDLGASNRYKMLDNYVSSKTENTGSIAVTVSCGAADTIALFGLSGTSVQIVVRAGGNVLSDTTMDLRLNPVSTWTEYLFGQREYRSDLVTSFYAIRSSLEVDITITGGVATCGHVIIGRSIPLGLTQWGASASVEDFSRKDTNDFGETTLVERAWAKLLEVDLWVEEGDGAELDRIQSILAKYRATPSVYDFNNYGGTRQALIVYGHYRTFELVAQYHTVTHCAIQIEGLT